MFCVYIVKLLKIVDVKKLVYISRLVISAIAVLLTGCTCTMFLMNGDIARSIFEFVLIIANIIFFIINCNMLNKKV